MRCEVEDRIDLVFAKHTLYVGGRSDIALFKGEVRLTIEYARVVEGCAMIEFIEGHDVVVGVCQD